MSCPLPREPHRRAKSPAIGESSKLPQLPKAYKAKWGLSWLLCSLEVIRLMAMFTRASWRLRAKFAPGPRAVVCLAMIVSYGFANVGYPVWEPVVGKGDVAFPCQFSACGCRTAEQCRKACCCHTKQQKIAWAVDRGIDPVRVAVLTAEEKASAKPSCCSQGAGKRQLRFVLAVEARKCTGAGVEWIQAGFVAVPPHPVEFVIALPQVVAVDEVLPSYLPPVSGQLLRPV